MHEWSPADDPNLPLAPGRPGILGLQMLKEKWPHFRFYALTNDGHVVQPATDCHLPDDAAAVRHAKIIIEDNAIEIWQGARVVARINPDDA